jgi:hypothetical protein
MPGALLPLPTYPLTVKELDTRTALHTAITNFSHLTSQIAVDILQLFKRICCLYLEEVGIISPRNCSIFLSDIRYHIPGEPNINIYRYENLEPLNFVCFPDIRSFFLAASCSCLPDVVLTPLFKSVFVFTVNVQGVSFFDSISDLSRRSLYGVTVKFNKWPTLFECRPCYKSSKILR